MPLGDLLFDVIEVAIIAGVLFIAYRALRLGSALVDRPYRTRAFGTAIGALTIVGFVGAGYLDGVFGQTPTTAEGVLVEAAAWGFSFIGLLFWVVTNNNVAINADYFNRDVLFWRSGGKWVTIGGVLIIYTLASLPPWWYPPQFYNNFFVGNGFNLVFFVAVAYAALVLVITFLRLKDRTIRTYTRWVLLSVVLMWASFFSLGPDIFGILLGGTLAVAYLYAMNHTVTVLAIRTKVLAT
jgi:hypothetical protein